MTHLTPADFETRYRGDPDPWSYETSAYEQAKYAATVNACGTGPFRCALELGSSIGVLTELLAPHCHRLVGVDASPTAVAAAQRRLGDVAHLELVCGVIPEAIPSRRYDLVVASEILYYLEEPALQATLDRTMDLMSSGGRLVAVHWRPPGPERPFSAAEVHHRLTATAGLTTLDERSTDDYLLHVFEAR